MNDKVVLITGASSVGSVNSFLGFASGSAYVASKHGLIGLTTSASAELAPQGIRVNLICPGIVDTPVVPKRSHGRSSLLCSDEASYVTGTTLTPDGGFTLTI